jgi:hypothetical protein
MRRGHRRPSGQKRQSRKRNTGFNLIRGAVKRKKVKASTRARERAARRKALAKGIEAIEDGVADLTDPRLVAGAQLLRTTPKAEKQKKYIRDTNIDAARRLLDMKADIAQLWNLADDEATAALGRRHEATLETAIRLVDEQARLIDEALGTEPSSAPLGPNDWA